MPRVLMVADSLGGGMGAAVAAGVRWLRPRGWEVVVAAPPVSTAVVTVDAEHDHLPVPGSARSIAGARAAARRLREIVDRRRPDLVHCHGVRSFALTRLLARQRSFVTLHGTGTSNTDPAGYHQVRRLGVAAVPRLAQGAFSAVPGLPGWTFAPHASPLLGSLERAPAPPADAPFLWLGRLEDPKQPERFVEAMAVAARERPLRGVIAGSGALEARVRQVIDRTGAPVELVGHRSDVVELIAASRAVVLLSRSEAVPFAIQEPLWAGRAVVASRLPGTMWLAGGSSGHGLTLVDDVADTAAALVRLADPEVAAADGVAAAEHVRAVLAPASPWPAVERAYRAVLEDGHARSGAS